MGGTAGLSHRTRHPSGWPDLDHEDRRRSRLLRVCEPGAAVGQWQSDDQATHRGEGAVAERGFELRAARIHASDWRRWHRADLFAWVPDAHGAVLAAPP